MLAATRLELAQQNLEIVCQATGLDIDILRRLVRAGVIDGLVPNWTDPGLADIEQAQAIAHQLQASRADLENVPITAADAETKYGFSYSTVYAWHNAGWVSVVRKEGRTRFFNEADIAMARTLADLQGQVVGKSVYPPKPRSGRPKKHG